MAISQARRLFFVVNPIAGSGRAKTCFVALKERLEAAGADFGFKYTAKPGEGYELTKMALEDGEGSVIAVGGDGTVRECASAYVDYCELKSLTGDERPVFGLFPVGTGNDFARPLGIKADVDVIAQGLLYDEPREIDMGFCDNKAAPALPFVNFSGFGFDVDVVKYTEKHKKRLNGLLPYMLGVFEAMLHLKPLMLTLTHENGEKKELSALLMSVCNGTHFGGGMNAAPKSSPSDGVFDVCILKSINIMQFIWLLPRYVKGRHLSSPHIRYFKTARLHVECDKMSLLNFDGELMGKIGEGLSADYFIKKGALRLIPGDMRG